MSKPTTSMNAPDEVRVDDQGEQPKPAPRNIRRNFGGITREVDRDVPTLRLDDAGRREAERVIASPRFYRSRT